MKKINLFLAMLVLLFIASCASTGGNKPSVNNAYRDTNDMPDWIEEPKILYKEYGMDTIVGSGSGKSATPQLSETAAKVAALQNIAIEVAAAIEAGMENFAAAEGYSADRALKAVENVGTVAAGTTIKGARIMERYYAKDGTVYVVYVVNQNSAINQVVNNVVSKAGPRDDELYAKFRSDEAKAELKAKLNELKR